MPSFKIKSRKCKFSKKSKKAWRNTDIKDVEDFYEEQLLEERLGGPFSEKPDEELFFIHKEPECERTESKHKNVNVSKQDKKKRALQPPRCFLALENTSKVPDPISVRNRVRTNEERKSKIQKDIEEKLRKRGILKHKEIMAAKNRLLNKKRANKKPDTVIFHKDIWGDEIKEEEKEAEWLEEDTVRHYQINTGKLVVKPPKSIQKKPSDLPNIENPHPGISYNPAPEDHNELLQIVADKENKMLEQEERLQRISAKFSKITPEKMMDNWMAEMSQGLFDNENPDDEHESNDESSDKLEEQVTKKPTKRKTLKEKKKKKERRAAEIEKQKEKVERAKISDLYRVRFLQRDIMRKEYKSYKLQEKRKEKKISERSKTKTLGPVKFTPPLLEFQRPHELRRNLRSIKEEGSILTDRFYSLQKRNIIEPRIKVKGKKAKVKKFFKPGHKLEEGADVKL